MEHKVRTVEQECARIASGAHGIVTRRELTEAGVTAAEIRRRVAKGALIPEHRGVFRVGHRAPSREARYLAAVKACGAGALLCDLAAAHLWGLVKGSAPPPAVVAPTERRVPGIDVWRCRRFDLADETT